MKYYLTDLAKKYDDVFEFLGQDDQAKVDAAIRKIIGKLEPGARCSWCFKDDVAWWKEEKMMREMKNPENWPFNGFIIPFPETNGRSTMEIEHVCVVITDYPIEKENPVTDWTTLASLLACDDLHEFRVL